MNLKSQIVMSNSMKILRSQFATLKKNETMDTVADDLGVKFSENFRVKFNVKRKQRGFGYGC